MVPPILPVAHTGARGAYSQLALRRFFGEARPGLTCRTVDEALEAVVQGRVSHAVVALENTITGFFAGVVEPFFRVDVAVVGEVVLPIRHCLLAVPGSRLEELSVVTSHPSALAQCRDWLKAWGVATRPSENTAQAAQDLAENGDRALGVLGSRELADNYGLEILAEGLSDRPDNRTRFWIVAGPGEVLAGRGERHALRIGPVEAPRTLKTLRIQLESFGATRVCVPLLGAEDGRHFLVEFDLRAGSADQVVRGACATLPHRYLGSWASSNVSAAAG